MDRNSGRISKPNPCRGLNLQKVCSLCCNNSLREKLYSCRVCELLFHLRCLKSKDQIHTEKDEKQFLGLVQSKAGWSCSNCENISNYLTEEEMQKIIDRFDRLDTNKDGTVGQEEFLLYQTAKHYEQTGQKMDKESLEMELYRFKAIDKDDTNSIDWWEFLQFEAVSCLSAKSKVELVGLLYPSEIRCIEAIFNSYDKYKTGLISYSNVGNVFLEWYTQFDVSSEDLSNMRGGVKERYKDIVEADADESGFIDWDEFLKHQAIYMISARPNNTNLHVLNRTRQQSLHTPVPFLANPVSAKNSNISSPLTAKSSTQIKSFLLSPTNSVLNSGTSSKTGLTHGKKGVTPTLTNSGPNVHNDGHAGLNKGSANKLRKGGSNVSVNSSSYPITGSGSSPAGVQKIKSAGRVKKS